MKTNDYECSSCGLNFTSQQNINDNPLLKCPNCQGNVQLSSSLKANDNGNNPLGASSQHELESLRSDVWKIACSGGAIIPESPGAAPRAADSTYPEGKTGITCTETDGLGTCALNGLEKEVT